MREVSPSDVALSTRDLLALRFIGEGYEVAQYHLHEGVFRGRAPNVVSRFVARARMRGLVAVERWNHVGINRLRLTSRGCAVLVGHGVALPHEVFVPSRAVAPKDLTHTLFINDVRTACTALRHPPNLALPAWALQRRLQPAPGAIPDLLAIWKEPAHGGGLVIACEIDLGGEGQRVLLGKLTTLVRVMGEWARNARSEILVFTRPDARRRSLEARLSTATAKPPEVRMLPTAPGRQSLAEFARVLEATCEASLRRE